MKNLLFIFVALIINSCGDSTPSSVDSDIWSESLTDTRGLIGNASSNCPGIIVFGDNFRQAGSSCMNWEIDVSSFTPSPVTLPSVSDLIRLIKPLLTEIDDKIHLTDAWKIHASTMTQRDLDGLMFSASAGKIVNVSGNVKSCDGKRSYPIGKQIDMRRGNRGTIDLGVNDLVARFYVHPSPLYCKQTVTLPKPNCPIPGCAQPGPGCTVVSSNELNENGCPKYPCGIYQCS